MEARKISIIIPCRNEEQFIGKCLDSIIANDYSKDRLEIMVVDGMSEDGTRRIVQRYTQRYSFVRLLDNPNKIIPTAMNIGIKNAKGDIIMKMDAHASYKRDYISKCVKYLYEYDADNVGGICKMVPRENTIFGKSIALALSNPFGAGDAHYKIGFSKKPKWVDTAPFGCYRRDIFQSIGLYDENIARSEDVNINSKLRRLGGKILLVPEIVIYYYTRSKFSELCKHSFDNGFWITYPLKFGRLLFSWRHLVPLAFASSLIGPLSLLGLLSLLGPHDFLGSLSLLSFLLIVALYFLCNIFFSTKIALREKDLRYLFIMPLIFATLHVVYGLGSLWGLLKTMVSGQFWKNQFIKFLSKSR